jgi:hypothetical protein
MGNPWTEHVKTEARKLGISYGCAMTDQRVKDSYRASKPPKAKKAKAKAVKARPKSISRSSSRSGSYKSSSSGSGSYRYSGSPAKKAKAPNSTKKLLKTILEDSGSFDPLASPKILRKVKTPNSTKQLLKTIMQESPLKLSTPEIIRQRRAVQRAGVVGRRTGAIVKRQVARDADSFEDIDEFFASSSSSGSKSRSK